MMTMEQLCRHIIRLLHTPIHVYSPSGEVLAVYIDGGEQQDLLASSDSLRRLLLAKGCADHPILHLEDEQIAYGVVTGEDAAYILGPCCLGGDEIAAARYLARKHGLNLRRPFRLYRTSLDHFCEMLLMLFEALTGRTMDANELYLKCFCDDQFCLSIHKKLHEVSFAMRESAAIHNPYGQELREQESIRTGDLNALYRSFQETFVGKFGTLSRDVLRNTKYLAVVVITLASRSAIQGGMIPEVAFSMSDAFIQKVDELRSPGEVMALTRQAEVEYCKSVAALSASKSQHPAVLRCKELIVQQLHFKVSIQELAKELDISPSYLSQLFAREEGVKLSDYIARERVEAAKNQLVYTGDSFETIACSYGFVSQSHFGQVFKKWAGMTPGQYREAYGRREIR